MRKRLKVIGLLLCFMMLALWVFSVMFELSYVPPSRQWSIAIASGRIVSNRNDRGIVVLSQQSFVLGHPGGWRCRSAYTKLKVEAAQIPWTQFVRQYLGYGLPGKDRGFLGSLYIPVWLLVVAVGFPTALLWWRDRRPKAGFCQVCKYDLTGNISGTCPECGTAIEDATKTNETTTPTDGA